MRDFVATMEQGSISKNYAFQCVMCDKGTNMVCIEEKVPLCCVECKNELRLDGGFFSKSRNNRVVRCAGKIEKITELPGLDNSSRARYEDGNKKLVITYDTGEIVELVKPFIARMYEYSFLIYDDLNISVDRLREHPTTFELFNFFTDQNERWKNKILEFPVKSVEDDRKILSFQCRGEEGPSMYFDVSVKNLKKGTGSYDFTDVITRILLRYPLTGIY